MYSDIYFNSNAITAIELAELNVAFYTAFVGDMPRCSAYAQLWPGQNLASLINQVRLEAEKNSETAARVAQVLPIYQTLYQKLTGITLPE